MKDHLGFADLPTLPFHRPQRTVAQEGRDTGMMLLSPGTRSALSAFERAVKGYSLGTLPIEHFRERKRALIRRLLRLEGALAPDPRGKRRKGSTR